MKTRADLHIHTTHSDGTLSPGEVVALAGQRNLAAIAITDHDTVDGIAEAVAAGPAAGVEVIPGVELSAAVDGGARGEMHILGYFIDPLRPQLLAMLRAYRDARITRAHKMLELLLGLGIALDKVRLFARALGGAVGRLHVAKELVESGFARDISDAFYKYLANGKPVYVPKMIVEPKDAIRLINESGGVAVLAHPYFGHFSDAGLLADIVQAGLSGIEAWHTKHSPAAAAGFLSRARELNLVATGGSDCHGPYRQDPAIIGTVTVPYTVVEELRSRAGK